MKAGIHPQYNDITAECSCGHVHYLKSTGSNVKIDVCSECHPFYTGKQKIVDTGGRVGKFENQFGAW